MGGGPSAPRPLNENMGIQKTPGPASQSRTAYTFLTRMRLDHARLSRVLREIEVQRANLTLEPDAARAVLTDALRYLAEYLHRYHHPREDRLYASLATARAEIGAELRALEREHEHGDARVRRLIAMLQRLTPDSARGRAGAQFARALQDYVDETRRHMRREERAVLFAGVERWLTPEEWRALNETEPPGDPLDDAASLRRIYPKLAAALTEPVRDVSGAQRAGPGRDGPHGRSYAALRDGAEELVDTYGELLHEGLDLLRANVATLWGAPAPLGTVGVLPQIGRRSYRYAARCVALPARVTLDCASRMLAAFAPEVDDDEPMASGD